MRRYETLDAVRGLAALSVVVFHWEMFYRSPVSCTPELPHKSVEPMFKFLWPIYYNGWIAVDLFFLISGFVFFHLYAQRVADKSVPLREFFVNRFSRLYPLHFATLLLVAALQAVVWQRHGEFCGGQSNNLKNFALQLFFASNWWPGAPMSFNGPVWSVSIEVLLYVIFFIVARIGLARVWGSVCMVVVGALLVKQDVWWELGRGIMSFYMGGLCLFVVTEFGRKSLFGLAVAVVAALALYRPDAVLTLSLWITVVVVFPLIIISLAANERRLEYLSRLVRWLGSISYSSYMLHGPLFVLIIIASEIFGFSLYPSSSAFMAIIFVTLILISLASYHFFERPIQDWLRTKLNRSDRKVSRSITSAILTK